MHPNKTTTPEAVRTGAKTNNYINLCSPKLTIGTVFQAVEKTEANTELLLISRLLARLIVRHDEIRPNDYVIGWIKTISKYE